MPRESRTTAQRPLIAWLARAGTLTDLLPQLHQHALDATGGDRTILFRHNPRNGVLQATSAFGLDALRTDGWQPQAEEAAIVARTFERREPLLVADLPRQMPDLADRLSSRTALLLPLVRLSERIGLLAIGFAAPPPPALADAAGDVSDAFVAALDLAHLRQRDELQRDVRALLDEFAASLASTLTLSVGLDIFCFGANRLFGADRTSVWIHDRRARHLTLQASSDEHVARGTRVATDDDSSPAAAAMRRDRAEIVTTDADVATSMVTVPLRGCRRALGTIVFEGARVEPGGELDVLDRADELGRQLSSAIENMQLLDDVMRARRELENTFDSIAHLIVVRDRRGRIVHVNRAFASRLGRPREELLDRPLSEFVGPELAGWLRDRDARAQEDGAVKDDDAFAAIEVMDARLKGPFIVTITDLRGYDRERAGLGILRGCSCWHPVQNTPPVPAF